MHYEKLVKPLCHSNFVEIQHQFTQILIVLLKTHYLVAVPMKTTKNGLATIHKGRSQSVPRERQFKDIQSRGRIETSRWTCEFNLARSSSRTFKTSKQPLEWHKPPLYGNPFLLPVILGIVGSACSAMRWAFMPKRTASVKTVLGRAASLCWKNIALVLDN